MPQPHTGPPAELLAWVDQTLGSSARVVGWERLTGGLTSLVHGLRIQGTACREAYVVAGGCLTVNGDQWIARTAPSEIDILAKLKTATSRPEGSRLDHGHCAGGPAALMDVYPGSFTWCRAIETVRCIQWHQAPYVDRRLESRALANGAHETASRQALQHRDSPTSSPSCVRTASHDPRRGARVPTLGKGGWSFDQARAHTCPSPPAMRRDRITYGRGRVASGMRPALRIAKAR